ncbi:MAG: hypothetical protein JXO22_00125 [Phycisphaerae bacterium]|nr:hypothetical protein [Phycisphaerae bacterium]
MNCPNVNQWELLAMETLEDAEASALLTHARECPRCRETYQAARRAHIERVRMYESFDRDHDRQREQLMASLPQGAPSQVSGGPVRRGWRRLGDMAMSINKTTTRRVIAVLTPAACIAIAALLILMPSNEPAFAAVVARLQKVDSLKCSIKGHVDSFMGKQQMTGTLYMKSGHGSRFDISVGDLAMIHQFASDDGMLATTVTPPARSVMYLDTSAIVDSGFGEPSPDMFIRQLREISDASAARELTPCEMGGKHVLGFEVKADDLPMYRHGPRSFGPAGRLTLWVDRVTSLPVSMIMEVEPDELGGIGLRMEYGDFEWDPQLDVALFVPDVPEDYTEMHVVFPPIGEATLIDGLRKYAELVGEYPVGLNEASMITGLSTMSVLAASDGKLDQQALTQKVLDVSSTCVTFMQFAREGRKPEYFGDLVMPDEDGEVLLRWTLDDGSTRVIYGDLHAETLPPAE